MKNICLIREDSTAAPIKLSLGEVVIGRGPLLECIDKRVSRNHALLKISDDGSILLVPTHTSPCYYTASANKEKELISRGKSITLQCGDRFALLPDSYCYRVVFTDNSKTENENITEETEKVNNSMSAMESDKTWCEGLDENKDTESKSHKNNNATSNGTTLFRAVEKEEIIEKKTSSLCIRKRVLPSWMLEDNGDTAMPKKIKNQPKTKKKGTNPNAEVKKKQKQKPFVEEPDTSGNIHQEEDCSDQQEFTDTADKVQSKTKLHSISDDEDSNSHPSNIKQEKVQKTKQHDISDNEPSDNELLNEQQESNGCIETADTANGNQQQNTSSTSNAIQPKSPNATQPKSPNAIKQKREQCKYGDGCYRKNPQHREEFSHPGDEDFEDDSDKPECPYGGSCYRKNKLHRQNFKHTTPAQRKAQYQTKRKKKDESDYESDDTYDEEDPFINNASSDDYQPTDSEPDSESISGGEEEEGARRMLKEAKRFVKKR